LADIAVNNLNAPNSFYEVLKYNYVLNLYT